MQRSSAVIAGGAETVEALVITSVWAVSVLRALSAVRMEEGEGVGRRGRAACCGHKV